MTVHRWSYIVRRVPGLYSGSGLISQIGIWRRFQSSVIARGCSRMIEPISGTETVPLLSCFGRVPRGSKDLLNMFYNTVLVHLSLILS